MALTQVNRGTTPNDNSADTLYVAFGKVNANASSLDITIETSSDSTFNSVKVGKGAGNIATNTVVGVGAGQSNTTGDNNTSIGINTLRDNLGGFSNTAIGAYAMERNQGGAGNTAVGTSSLYSNTSGYGNTACGKGTLTTNTIGVNNTALGSGALAVNLVGNDNVAIGNSALISSLGSANTAVGHLAGQFNTNFNNTTCLGYNAQASAGDQIVLGNTAINALRCNVQTITSLSDGRDKTDIVEITEGLEFINKLKPVTFTWNQRDEGRVGIKSAGFIAQDLLELQNDSLIGENLDLVSENDTERLEARYANLLPVMIKAIQELTARINVLENN